MHEKEVARMLLETGAVSLRIKPAYVWTSGLKAPIYTDNRTLISHPKEREQMIGFFVELIEKNNIEFEVIAGTATAGIPWASFLAQKLQRPMVYVKKRAKEHGTQKLIEGILGKGQEVLVVEDLISTGGSSLQAVNAIREAGCMVRNCIAIFTYELAKAEQAFKKNKCELFALSNFNTLVEVAAQNDYIKQEEKELVLGWKKNPEQWGT